MGVVSTIVITILVFAGIVVLHEFGHFVVAKLSGIYVQEFSIGFGPAIFKIHGKETVYALRWIPLGGYVMMLGEEGDSDDPRSFNRAAKWKRFLVLIAGATMNLLLGFVILIFVTALTPGRISSTTIAQFADNAVSSQYGLQPNDQIIAINGNKVRIDQDIVFELSSVTGDTVNFTVLRDGKKVDVPNVKFATKEVEGGQRILSIDFLVYGIDKTVGSVLKQASLRTVSFCNTVWSSLGKLITGSLGINQLSGPVGVATAIGEAASVSYSSLFVLVALLTVNIGIFNLLPFPALDGGKILLLLVEAIRRKPMKPEHEGYMNLVGFGLIMILFVFVTYHDIVRLITGG